MRLETGSQAPDITLGRAGGDNIALSELWREKPLVLAFLRHFG